MTSINYFWVGDTFSEMELLTFKSCWKNSHRPVVWSFEKINNVPEYVVIEDASKIMSREMFFHYSKDLLLPLANISDIFRYSLFKTTGGYYSDTDVIILRNLDSIGEEEFFCSSFEYGYGECANGCFMKLQQDSKVVNFLIEECNNRLQEIERSGSAAIEYCYIGPFVVQKCAAETGIKVLPYDFINPISWRWVTKLIAFRKPDQKFLLKSRIRKALPSIESRGYGLTGQTFAVHLCNEIWKKEGLNKNEAFHSWSIYERLKLRLSK